MYDSYVLYVSSISTNYVVVGAIFFIWLHYYVCLLVVVVSSLLRFCHASEGISRAFIASVLTTTTSSYFVCDELLRSPNLLPLAHRLVDWLFCFDLRPPTPPTQQQQPKGRKKVLEEVEDSYRDSLIHSNSHSLFLFYNNNIISPYNKKL